MPITQQSTGSPSEGIEQFSLVGSSVVTLDDIPIPEVQLLLDKAQYIDEHRKEVANTCNSRVLATLFYEPSTRTRLSFETAMLRLGAKSSASRALSSHPQPRAKPYMTQ